MENEKRLIDANALYTKLGKMAREPYYQHDGDDYYVGIADASMEVHCAPTVDAVEVVHGRWIKPPHHKTHCKCSNCGRFPIRGMPNYCPNCGAKMDKETKFAGICERCEYREECDWPKLHPKIELKKCPDFNEGEKNKNG